MNEKDFEEMLVKGDSCCYSRTVSFCPIALTGDHS